MGSFKSTSKTKTTPTVTDPMQQNLFGNNGFASQISNFAHTDPSQYVAPASALQNTAFGNAQNVGGWKDPVTAASAAAGAAGAIPAGQATTTNAGAQGYAAPTLGHAAQVGAVNVAPVTNANATTSQYQSILDNGGVQKYMDPAIDSYVKAAMANFDQTYGETRAATQADAAKNGAFGGSRYGVQMGELDSNNIRNRALTDAQLRAEAYTQALGAAGQDTALRQSTDVSNAGLQTGVSVANAGAANSRAAQMAQLAQDRGITNAGATNQFSLTQAQMEQAARAAQAQAANQASLTNAGAANTTSMFNTQQQSVAADRALQAASLQGQLGIQGGQLSQQDLALQAQIGEMQRAIETAQRNAVPTQLQIAGSLYGAIPPASYIGQNSKTTSTPGLGNVAAGLGGSALAGWASGGIKF